MSWGWPQSSHFLPYSPIMTSSSSLLVIASSCIYGDDGYEVEIRLAISAAPYSDSLLDFDAASQQPAAQARRKVWRKTRGAAAALFAAASWGLIARSASSGGGQCEAHSASSLARSLSLPSPPYPPNCSFIFLKYPAAVAAPFAAAAQPTRYAAVETQIKAAR